MERKKSQFEKDMQVLNEKEHKHAFSSGATSSQKVTRYDLCIFNLFTRIANIFRYGAEKHGDVNYQKCITVSEDGYLTLDVEFARDRFNHGFKHLLNIKTGEEQERDNIGAVGWALSFMVWVEEKGFNWHRILNPRLLNEVSFSIHPDKKTMLVKVKDDTLDHFEPR